MLKYSVLKKILYCNFIFLITVLNLIVITGFVLVVFSKDSNVIAGVLTFIGALIGGTITFFGVRLTIKEQHRLYFHEKYEKAEYIYTKLVPKIVSLNSFIKEINQLNASERFAEINQSATSLTDLLEEHSKILLETEYRFINQVETIGKSAKLVTEYLNSNNMAGLVDMEVKENLIVILNHLNLTFDRIQAYIREIT